MKWLGVEELLLSNKKNLSIFFGIILVILCVILAKSCKLTDNYSLLLGQYTTLQGITKENTRIAQEHIDTALVQIEKLNSTNAELNNNVKIRNQAIWELDGDVVRLEDELTTIRTKVETIPNLKEQVVNLEGQVNTWKGKFTLAEKIITDKDAIIFNLKQQYGLQLNVSIEYKALYESEFDLRDKCEGLLKITTRKLRTAKFGGTIKTMVMGVLGGYLAYRFIK